MEENVTPISQEIPKASNPRETKSSNGKLIFVSVIALVLLAGASVAYYKQYLTLQDSKKELSEAKSKIATLEEEAKVLRDAKRKKDVALFTQALRNYKAKNGSYPTTEGSQSQNIYNDELSKYVEDFTEPTTDKLYGFEAIAQVHTPSPLAVGTIQYQWLGKCNPTNQDFVDTTSENDAAIRTVLESGETYCLDI